MPSNTTLNSGSGGDAVVSKQRSHDGDTAKQQGVFLSGVTGTEDAYTFTDVQAGNGTAAGALRVSVASDSTGTIAATQSGTWNITNVSGTVSLPTGAATSANQSTAITALQLIDNPVLAHDTAVGSTQVSMAGARATSSVEGITQVANDDGTRIHADLNGVLITRPHTTLNEITSERVADTAGTSADFTGAFAAPGAGNSLYVTSIAITNTNASTSGYVDFRDGSAGSVRWSMPAPAEGGSVMSFDPPLKFPANTAVAYDVSAAITTVIICVNGFTAKT